MDRPIRRRSRWRPARIDFLTWALPSVWDVVGRLMAGFQDLGIALRRRPDRRARRRPAPVWFGSRPANS
jgi:hypothetical protein